ncbi:unnamed protein product [Cladocopium goreaui]|uniref:Uncharacterized protein n=1 Tax=Cladocopium goreaui TaxID=2562237 RepID=A0A9P1DCF5_9DINO|nr:unnamed protein product [Cladocopium goreaui]
MAFGRVVLLWIHISLSLASRGDEPAEAVTSQSESSKIWGAFSATHDWLHVTGPSPMVTVMSQRGQLCTICIFGLATFAMLRQIYSAYQTLMQGIQQVSKIQEEAPVQMSPASFVAAANEAGDPQVIPCGNGKMVINLEILGCWGVYFETNPCDHVIHVAKLWGPGIFVWSFGSYLIILVDE